MRQNGDAVVPAVARAVIDAPGAPGPAAVGWRRSPDRCAPAALPNARCAAPRRAPRAPPALRVVIDAWGDPIWFDADGRVVIPDAGR